MGIGLGIAKILVSALLLISLIAFTVSLEISNNLDQEDFKSLISRVGSDIVEDEIIENLEESGLEDLEEFYDEALEECANRDEISFGGEGEFEINCDELRAVGGDGIDDYLKDQIEEITEEEINQQLEDVEAFSYLEYIDYSWIFFGILSLIFIVILFLISSPKYTFLTLLGIIGMAAGIPFIFVRKIGSLVAFESESANLFLSGIINDLFSLFSMQFIIGLLFFLVGFTWMIIFKKELKRK